MRPLFPMKTVIHGRSFPFGSRHCGDNDCDSPARDRWISSPRVRATTGKEGEGFHTALVCGTGIRRRCPA